jgi:SAM-dependent methyltransferase
MTSIDSPMAADSTVSDEDGDTQTLAESLLHYPVHWGRTYHRYNAGSYRYPNDADELDRMDFIHHTCTRLHQGRLFFAPIGDARKVLDLGTGTGIWPIDLADSKLCPNARITGVDLSPTQPNDVPENVRFESNSSPPAPGRAWLT